MKLLFTEAYPPPAKRSMTRRRIQQDKRSHGPHFFGLCNPPSICVEVRLSELPSSTGISLCVCSKTAPHTRLDVLPRIFQIPPRAIVDQPHKALT